MRVGVVGGGAIGLLSAAYFKKSGYEVTIYTRSKQQAEELKVNGIILKKDTITENIFVDAKPMNVVRGFEEEIVFVTVKQFHLKEFFEALSPMFTFPKTMVFLQNGMGHLSVIKDLPIKSCFVGIVEHGAMRLSTTKVHHTGTGSIKIGAINGNVHDWRNLWETLTKYQFPMVEVNNWKMVMQRKLVVNACINPLTAIYRVPNGRLRTNPYFLKLMRVVYEEAIESLDLEKTEDLWEEVLLICEKTANNRSSMLRDIENKNETEIDSITGYIIEKGEEKGLRMQVTTFLFETIKGIQWEERENVE